jgi:hypothetical protein
VITGLIIVLACAVLSPYLAFIPTSVLSAVIIFSMFSTIAYKLPLKLWRSQRECAYALLICCNSRIKTVLYLNALIVCTNIAENRIVNSKAHIAVPLEWENVRFSRGEEDGIGTKMIDNNIRHPTWQSLYITQVMVTCTTSDIIHDC